MPDIDVNLMMWGIFASVTMKAAVHIGQDYQEKHNQENTLRASQNIVRHLAEIDPGSQNRERLCYMTERSS